MAPRSPTRLSCAVLGTLAELERFLGHPGDLVRARHRCGLRLVRRRWRQRPRGSRLGSGAASTPPTSPTADVAVVTNVELDHTEILGDDPGDRSRRRRPGSSRPARSSSLASRSRLSRRSSRPRPSSAGSTCDLAARGASSAASRTGSPSVGGWSTCGRRSGDSREVLVPLHGAHQADNAACAVAAAQAFLETPLDAGSRRRRSPRSRCLGVSR